MNASTLTLPVLPSAWRRPLLALCAILLLVVLSYYDTAAAMVGIWNRSETFAHAFVVPPLSLWLIWRRRGVLAGLPTYPVPWLAAPMLLLVAAWLLGDLVGVDALTQLMLVAMLVLAVPALLGWAVARELIFPLGFLFFAVPLGEFMTPWLMQYTADFTVAALRASGVPVYREGLKFVIPSGSWSVVEACSGIRYLIASVMVGTLFAYLNYRSLWRRWAFVGVAIAVPIGANWLRAYMIVMLGHLSGNTIAVGVDHLVYGWAFFGVVIMLMFLIGARWSEPDQPVAVGVPASAGRPMAASALGQWSVAAALVLVVALPGLIGRAIDNQARSAAPVMVAPAQLAAGWAAADVRTFAFKPAFENPSAEINSAYSGGNQVVGLYLAYYENQDYQRKLVSSNNVLVVADDPGWSRASPGQVLAKAGEQMVSLRTTELRNLRESDPVAPARLVAWQIYWIDGTLTASDYMAKAYSALHRLTGRGDHSAVIIVYTAQDPAGAGSAALQSFLQANYAAIDVLLRQARN